MNSGTTDNIKGKLHEAAGKVKEETGKAVNDPELEAKGQDEKIGGKIQNKVGQIKKVFDK